MASKSRISRLGGRLCMATNWSKAIDALLEQTEQRVIAAGPAAGIIHRPGHGLGQPQLPIDLGKQSDALITSDIAAAEIGFNFAAFNGWKWERTLVAFCRGGISCC